MGVLCGSVYRLCIRWLLNLLETYLPSYVTVGTKVPEVTEVMVGTAVTVVTLVTFNVTSVTTVTAVPTVTSGTNSDNKKFVTKFVL